MYGGEPVLFTTDYRNPIDVEALRTFLEKDADFKYATVVHCDTPSGVRNDISKICPLLAEYGILNVVDSVAGMFGEPVDFDASCIDIPLRWLTEGAFRAAGSDDGMGQRESEAGDAKPQNAGGGILRESVQFPVVL